MFLETAKHDSFGSSGYSKLRRSNRFRKCFLDTHNDFFNMRFGVCRLLPHASSMPNGDCVVVGEETAHTETHVEKVVVGVQETFSKTIRAAKLGVATASEGVVLRCLKEQGLAFFLWAKGRHVINFNLHVLPTQHVPILLHPLQLTLAVWCRALQQLFFVVVTGWACRVWISFCSDSANGVWQSSCCAAFRSWSLIECTPCVCGVSLSHSLHSFSAWAHLCWSPFQLSQSGNGCCQIAIMSSVVTLMISSISVLLFSKTDPHSQLNWPWNSWSQPMLDWLSWSSCKILGHTVSLGHAPLFCHKGWIPSCSNSKRSLPALRLWFGAEHLECAPWCFKHLVLCWVLTLKKVPMVFCCHTAHGAHHTVVWFLLVQKCIKRKPIANPFLQSLLIGLLKLFCSKLHWAPVDCIMCIVTPFEFVAQVLAMVLCGGGSAWNLLHLLHNNLTSDQQVCSCCWEQEALSLSAVLSRVTGCHHLCSAVAFNNEFCLLWQWLWSSICWYQWVPILMPFDAAHGKVLQSLAACWCSLWFDSEGPSHCKQTVWGLVPWGSSVQWLMVSCLCCHRNTILVSVCWVVQRRCCNNSNNAPTGTQLMKKKPSEHSMWAWSACPGAHPAPAQSQLVEAAMIQLQVLSWVPFIDAALAMHVHQSPHCNASPKGSNHGCWVKAPDTESWSHLSGEVFRHFRKSSFPKGAGLSVHSSDCLVQHSISLDAHQSSTEGYRDAEAIGHSWHQKLLQIEELAQRAASPWQRDWTTAAKCGNLQPVWVAMCAVRQERVELAALVNWSLLQPGCRNRCQSLVAVLLQLMTLGFGQWCFKHCCRKQSSLLGCSSHSFPLLQNEWVLVMVSTSHPKTCCQVSHLHLLFWAFQWMLVHTVKEGPQVQWGHRTHGPGTHILQLWEAVLLEGCVWTSVQSSNCTINIQFEGECSWQQAGIDLDHWWTQHHHTNQCWAGSPECSFVFHHFCRGLQHAGFHQSILTQEENAFDWNTLVLALNELCHRSFSDYLGCAQWDVCADISWLVVGSSLGEQFMKQVSFFCCAFDMERVSHHVLFGSSVHSNFSDVKFKVGNLDDKHFTFLCQTVCNFMLVWIKGDGFFVSWWDLFQNSMHEFGFALAVKHRNSLLAVAQTKRSQSFWFSAAHLTQRESATSFCLGLRHTPIFIVSSSWFEISTANTSPSFDECSTTSHWCRSSLTASWSVNFCFGGESGKCGSKWSPGCCHFCLSKTVNFFQEGALLFLTMQGVLGFLCHAWHLHGDEGHQQCMQPQFSCDHQLVCCQSMLQRTFWNWFWQAETQCHLSWAILQIVWCHLVHLCGCRVQQAVCWPLDFWKTAVLLLQHKNDWFLPGQDRDKSPWHPPAWWKQPNQKSQEHSSAWLRVKLGWRQSASPIISITSGTVSHFLHNKTEIQCFCIFCLNKWGHSGFVGNAIQAHTQHSQCCQCMFKLFCAVTCISSNCCLQCQQCGSCWAAVFLVCEKEKRSHATDAVPKTHHPSASSPCSLLKGQSCREEKTLCWWQCCFRPLNTAHSVLFHVWWTMVQEEEQSTEQWEARHIEHWTSILLSHFHCKTSLIQFQNNMALVHFLLCNALSAVSQLKPCLHHMLTWNPELPIAKSNFEQWPLLLWIPLAIFNLTGLCIQSLFQLSRLMHSVQKPLCLLICQNWSLSYCNWKKIWNWQKKPLLKLKRKIKRKRKKKKKQTAWKLRICTSHLSAQHWCQKHVKLKEQQHWIWTAPEEVTIVVEKIDWNQRHSCNKSASWNDPAFSRGDTSGEHDGRSGSYFALSLWIRQLCWSV